MTSPCTLIASWTTERQDNIAKNGNVVAHPRTGQPIENPYIKVRVAAMGQLRKIRLRKVDALWTEVKA